ncbi:MAG: hypothetical protein ACI3U8_07765 [Candidatus Onthomonas sp.]
MEERKIDPALVEIHAAAEEAYHPLIWEKGWRVAILNDAPRFRRENITYLERHQTSDEVFVLLEGECTLTIGESGSETETGSVRYVAMERDKLYNVKRGVWHNCLTQAGTKLLIVENADVSRDNTLYAPTHLR